MTVHIEVEKREGGHVIHVDGWLEGEEEAAELLHTTRLTSGPVVLDLKNLRSADSCGIAALQTLSGEGTRLRCSSDYINLLLDSVKDTEFHRG